MGLSLKEAALLFYASPASRETPEEAVFTPQEQRQSSSDSAQRKRHSCFTLGPFSREMLNETASALAV